MLRNTTEIRLRPGAKLNGLAQTLIEQSGQARNAMAIVTQHPRDQLESYIRWASNAAKMLGNHLMRDAAEGLIYSNHFWSLRQTEGFAADTSAQVHDELMRQAFDLEELHNYVRELADRWNLVGTIVVPDTNILVHSKTSFDELNWPASLNGETSVHLVIPLVVIDELDSLKRNGKDKARTAARHALKKIEDLVTDPNKRVVLPQAVNATSITTLELFMDPLGHQRLNRPDSEIVDRAAQIKELVENQVAIASWDMGMRLRARNAGLSTIAPPPADEIIS